MNDPLPDSADEDRQAENARVANRTRLVDMLLIAQHVIFPEGDGRQALMEALRTGLHRLFESEGGRAE